MCVEDSCLSSVDQVPGSFPMQDAFEAVHDLIITKPKLYNRLISVYAHLCTFQELIN